jgi:phage gp46-like protein
MTDLALLWSPEAMQIDLSLVDGALATDDGLQTAILISLFTDARALADDILPEPNADRRGWWGDLLSVSGDQTGSRLWLLAREKQLSPVLARAEGYAREALGWMIEDQIAAGISVAARFPSAGWLGLEVLIDRPNGPARQRYDLAWSATELKVSA